MTPQPNTFYRTRSGNKAFVGYMAPDWIGGDFPLKGWIFLQGEWRSHCWKADGTWHSTVREDPDDLVEEWKEPVSRTVELLLLESGLVVFANNGRVASSGVVATKTVTITEGEGMQ